MKKLLKKIWGAIASLFKKANDEVKKLVPVAINVVEGIKNVMDSPADDVLAEIIKHAIPGDADDILIDKITATVKEYIPKVLLDLKLVDSIANIENDNDKLNAILAQLKLSGDEAKNIIYHGLCSLILEKLSDGELSWSDAVAISEYYYSNVVRKEGSAN